MVVDVAYISKERSDDLGHTPGSVTGILAVQGAFAEHAAMLDRLGAPWRLLRAAEDFDESIGRVILPGGDMRGDRLEQAGGAQQFALRGAFAAGKPVFGTCAGMILLARRLENDANAYFGALDATVRRNAYGRQLGSFAAEETVRTFDAQGEPSGEITDFPLVFIRGPFVAEVGPDARVMTSTRGNAVALQQGNIIATAFHPEITDDPRIHEYFLSL